MARYLYQSQVRDGMGRIIQNADVNIYLAGTTTPAIAYSTSASPTVISSTSADNTGAFSFWIDDADYPMFTRFKMVISKPAYQTQIVDNLVIPGMSGTTQAQALALTTYTTLPSVDPSSYFFFIYAPTAGPDNGKVYLYLNDTVSLVEQQRVR